MAQATVTGNFAAVAPSPYASGKVAATGVSAAFKLPAGRSLWARLRANTAAGSAPGSFTATVAVQKSTDDGQTWDGLTLGGAAAGVFTAPVNEPVSNEEDAQALYRLVCTTFTSGPVYYWLGLI